MAAVRLRAARVCGPKAHTPEPPAGARIYWRVVPINSSYLYMEIFGLTPILMLIPGKIFFLVPLLFGNVSQKDR